MSDNPEGFEWMMRRRVIPAGDGTYLLMLDPEERDVLRNLPAELKELLVEGRPEDPGITRLFPPAYTDDDEANDEYQRLMHSDLLERRVSSLSVMEDTVDATTLTSEQLLAWMSAVNDVRLVLGTRLDVTEDMYEAGIDSRDPRAPVFELYSYLGLVMEHIVEALDES